MHACCLTFEIHEQRQHRAYIMCEHLINSYHFQLTERMLIRLLESDEVMP